MEDVNSLSVIEKEAFRMPWSAASIAQLTKQDYSLCLVAEADGKVAGFCVLTDLCGEGSIDNVAVSVAFRGRGIAQKLLEELLRLAKNRGIGDITLEVRVSNEPAIHIYEKLGFVSEGVRPGFYEKPVEDALIMWRRCL